MPGSEAEDHPNSAAPADATDHAAPHAEADATDSTSEHDEAHAAATAAATAAVTAAEAKAERRRTDARSRVTGVIVVGMSVAVWWPAFTLGAWGDFFFDQMLTIWAAATGVFIVVLVQPRGKPRIWRALALLIPSLWLALSFVVVDEDPGNWLVDLVTVLGIIVAFLAVPATIWVLVRIIWPEFAEDITWPRRLAVLGAVLLIAVASFLLGVTSPSSSPARTSRSAAIPSPSDA